MKKRWILVIIPIVLIIITIGIGANNVNREKVRDLALAMISEDCFALDAEWDEAANHYKNDKYPTKWDCSRDIFGNPK